MLGAPYGLSFLKKVSYFIIANYFQFLQNHLCFAEIKSGYNFIQVDVEIAKQSVTIKTMLDDLGIGEDDDEGIPLPNVNAAILKKAC